MSSSAKSDLVIAKSSLKADLIFLVGITWATVAMVYFLLYSTNPPDWYSPVTYIFECSAYLGASLLCLRNWQSPQIVSGRNVWLVSRDAHPVVLLLGNDMGECLWTRKLSDTSC